MKLTTDHITKHQLYLLKNKWHPRNKISIEETTIGSHIKYWWRCNKKHEWQARINTVIRGIKSNTGACPFCRGLKIDKSNCLAATHPELAKQWHPDNDILPVNITAGCNKKAYWRCRYGHKWLATILSRKQGNNCPYCSKKLIDSQNCLSATHPELAKQWHPTKNKKITPNMIAGGSRIKIWWKCPVAEDHEWKTSANKRTSERGCPCCSGKKIVKSNCLATLFPTIAAEWHPTKNGNISPLTISPGSQKKYWWVCNISPHHEWMATIQNRTLGGTGCPFCDSSKGEAEVSNILNNMGILFEIEKTFSTCKDKGILFFDFYVEYKNEYKLIEYQGIQHYKPIFGSDPISVFNGIKRRDKIKREWCKKEGIKLLEIPYWNFDKINEIINHFLQV